MLTLQDLRICSDILRESGGKSDTWTMTAIQEVADKIDEIFEGVQVVETLPGKVPVLDFVKGATP